MSWRRGRPADSDAGPRWGTGLPALQLDPQLEPQQIATGTYTDPGRGHFIRVRPPRWRHVPFGKFYECPECYGLVEGKFAKTQHFNWHEELNELLRAIFGGENAEENDENTA